MESQKGIALAYLTALVSGISIFANSYGVLSMDATAYTFVKNALVAVILISLAFMLRGYKEFFTLNRKQILLLAFSGIVGGGIAFVLFFSGLSLLSGAVSSFLYRLLFLFAIGTGVLLLKEKFSWKIAAGALAVLSGNFFLLGGAPIFLSEGVLLVLAASALWALEYAVSKMALQSLSPLTVASSRMGIGAIVILGILIAQGNAGGLLAISPTSFIWIAIAVGLLTLFTTLWYSALKQAPLISCTAIFTLGGPISALLSFAFAGKALSPLSAAGFLLISVGVIFAVGIGETLLALRYLGSKALQRN